MKKYRKKNKDIIELKRTVFDIAQDTLYVRGEYLPPIPQKKPDEQVIPKEGSIKEANKLKVPIKTLTKKQLLKLISQNDN